MNQTPTNNPPPRMSKTLIQRFLELGVTVPFFMYAAMQRENKYFRVGGTVAAGVAFLVALDSFEEERKRLKEENQNV